MIARLYICQNPKEEINKNINLPNPHPDLLYFDSTQKLGIEQARKIKDYLSIKAYSSKGKVVVLEDASKLTDEAQNSLLKTLEELPESTLFIMGATNDSNFLPTVLSRCQIIRVKTNTSDIITDEVEKLMHMDIAGRFEYIEKCKDKQKLLTELTAYFRNKELLQAEEWADANVNIRAILEYLMLVLPAGK